MRGLLRRLRGALGNAAVWGVSWFSAAFALLSGGNLMGLLPVPDAWRFILSVSVSTGITGFVVGGLFSGFLRLAYRNRPLLDIRARRFALGGAVVAGVVMPLLGVVMRSAIGVPVILGDLIASGLWGAAFGGVTAGITIKAAQYAERRLARPDEVASVGGGGEEALDDGRTEDRSLLPT